MDSCNSSNPSKPSRGRKTASTSKPRRQSRKKVEAQSFNVGQVHLLLALMSEFASELEAPSFEEDGDIELTLTSDMPGLEAFVQFKLENLKKQQDVLEALYAL
ncbi:hypothetical protein D3C72_248120 [compost metagenome]